MQEFLIIVACVIIAVALRSCRTLFLRKLGALAFLLISFLAFYFIFDCCWTGTFGITIWFLLPWCRLLTKIRKLKFPVKKRLTFKKTPSEHHFPNATQTIKEIEEANFEHITDSGWESHGMQQFFRLYWHAEDKFIASVCLCEHDNIAFAFMTISCRTTCGKAIHTTNFPFAPSLKHHPDSHWDHLPCEKNRFSMIFHDHEKHLARLQLSDDNILIPDPDDVPSDIENEMQAQIEHNVESGLIKLTGDGHFRYSMRGLFFLWKQSVKDMIRLC